MNQIYRSIIVVLVFVVAWQSIVLLNKNKKPEVQSTNLTEQKLENKTQEKIQQQSQNNQNNMQENNQTGLIIEVLKEGNGAEAKNGDVVSVHYTGMFADGSVFDSSVSRGLPFEFNLGAGMVIPGWDQGVLGMKIGEKRKLTIPSDLAYGPNDYGPIPGGSTLFFEVELLGLK